MIVLKKLPLETRSMYPRFLRQLSFVGILIGTRLALRDDRGAIPSWLSGIGLPNNTQMQTEHAVGPKSNGADDSGSTI